MRQGFCLKLYTRHADLTRLYKPQLRNLLLSSFGVLLLVLQQPPHYNDLQLKTKFFLHVHRVLLLCFAFTPYISLTA